MVWLLETLRDFPLDADQLTRLRRTPEWLQAWKWGWVMESGELTGIGSTHAAGEDLPGGILD